MLPTSLSVSGANEREKTHQGTQMATGHRKSVAEWLTASKTQQREAMVDQMQGQPCGFWLSNPSSSAIPFCGLETAREGGIVRYRR
jgi:hypothetical protein